MCSRTSFHYAVQAGVNRLAWGDLLHMDNWNRHPCTLNVTYEVFPHVNRGVAEVLEMISIWGASNDIEEMVELEQIENETIVDKFYHI